jgi:hypothetical protein
MILKSNTFLNDIYRSYLCVCFPPNVLCAAAIFMSALYLKVNLQVRHLSESFRVANGLEVADGEENLNIMGFPWNELFAAEPMTIKKVAELTYQFIKIIKS